MTPDRQRFLEELDTNFSVQAAAGTGKTTALVGRVARIARERPEILGQLVVVTYTHRAADEMRQRLREHLLRMEPGTAAAGGLLWKGLSRMFIGTIHGFCLRLIGEYGPWLGCGTALSTEDENDPALFRDFARTEAPESPSWMAPVHRVIPARDISALARQLAGKTVDWTEAAKGQNQTKLEAKLAALKLDPQALEGLSSSNAKARTAIERWRRHWQELAARWNGADASFVPIPAYDGTGGKELAQCWPESLGPWADVLLRAALHAAIAEAASFQEFRIRTGRLFFGDQIVLAHRLLRNPEIRARLLGEEFHILLDEAQDTDPLQFELLAELSRPPGSAPFAWPGGGESPLPGHFIMVGDAQQAIYRDRATIGTYRRYHEAIGSADHGAALTFAETFRCRPRVAAFVNHRFRNILTGGAGQASFVPLEAATDDSPGGVARWVRPPAVGNHAMKTARETRWLAARLRELGPSGLHARSWDEVAILCPAREWLNAFHHALKEAGVPSVLHFDRPQSQQPEYLWLAALLTLQLEPNNEFEIAGVLRELHGVSDDLIYRFRTRDGIEKMRPLRLHPFKEPAGPIEELLAEWHAIRAEAETLPLADAVILWSGRTRLRERLAALPNGAAGVRGLDRLLLRAHQAQQAKGTLRDFWRDLLLGVDRPGAEWEGPQRPQVQLMTMKKAKGLQWDAVILPFLGHVNLPGGRGDYPKVICPVGSRESEGEEEPHPRLEAALSSSFHSSGLPELRALDEEENERERGRLFYVACTRARYTLVLVDDAKVWERETQQGLKLPSPNGYEALRGAAETGETFVNPLDLSQAYLGEEIQVPSKPASTTTALRSAQSSPAADAWPRPVPLAPVRHRGKKLPSRHEEADPDFLAGAAAAASLSRAQSLQPRREWIGLGSAGSNHALLYGVWWHDTLRRWPWHGVGRQKAFIAQALSELPEGPTRERGSRELEIFCASETYRLLSALPSERRLQEIPYARPLGSDWIEDGQIDLLYRAEDGAWTLLDWKTDNLAEEECAVRLRQLYSSQLFSYRNAVATFGLPVGSCRVYSTPWGVAVDL